VKESLAEDVRRLALQLPKLVLKGSRMFETNGVCDDRNFVTRGYK